MWLSIIFRNQLINSNEAVHLVVEIATVFNECAQQLTGQTFDVLHTFDQLIYECCRLLRNSCAIGKAIQCQIAGIQFNTHSIYETINIVLLDVPNPQSILSQRTHKMCWQFVANLCVQNDTTQRHIWMECIAPLLPKIKCICETENGHECTMILYNLFINDILSTNDVIRIVEILLQCILDQHDLRANDFHQLFMEYLLTKYRTIPMVCDRIAPAEKRIQLIYYAAEHLRAINHEPISTPLLQFVCKEFKKKSDCVLRATISSLDAIHPREVVALLDAIARASSDERYSHILADDRSLFINIGCLLRSIHDVGRQQTNENDTNIFAPVQKLTQLAPNSSESSNIEREISYQLKSTLIRTLANLAYKNRDNQNLVGISSF